MCASCCSESPPTRPTNASSSSSESGACEACSILHTSGGRDPRKSDRPGGSSSLSCSGGLGLLGGQKASSSSVSESSEGLATTALPRPRPRPLLEVPRLASRPLGRPRALPLPRRLGVLGLPSLLEGAGPAVFFGGESRHTCSTTLGESPSTWPLDPTAGTRKAASFWGRGGEDSVTTLPMDNREDSMLEMMEACVSGDLNVTDLALDPSSGEVVWDLEASLSALETLRLTPSLVFGGVPSSSLSVFSTKMVFVPSVEPALCEPSFLPEPRRDVVCEDLRC
ncbi:hypothetical protein E2C01_033584 [Portunus trituberculatus]|uniref:Uncharacterized protein n=1 Tax=Portunus trituberculatus TaxID=210409 RepID=A0A5B7F452_PORTR|nr:hypothetical protein [Portunus trituberculatus]